MLRNLTVINSTKREEILSQLEKLEVKGAHFTNGTYALPTDLIVPTTLAGFKYAMQLQPQLPLVIAVNSDASMKNIGKTDCESQTVRALKAAEPLAELFPDNKVIVLFYDETTPNQLYTSLNRHGHTRTHHKWGYGTDASAPKIEGAELFECVYAYPMPNDQKPICWNETPLADKPQDIKVADLRGKLIATDGLLFELPEKLKQYQSSALAEEKFQPTTKLAIG